MHPQTADDSVLAIAMVETATGLAAIEDIVAVHGLDAVYVGPNDLALSLGLGRTDCRQSRQLVEAIDQILEACRACGVETARRRSRGSCLRAVGRAVP